MEDPQYARTAATGFSVIDGPPARLELDDGGRGDAAREAVPEGMCSLQRDPWSARRAECLPRPG